MKLFKKIISFVLAAIMMVAMGATSVFAEEGNTISVSGAKDGETYNIYKLLDLAVNDEDTPTAFRYTTNTKWAGFWTDGAGKDYVKIENGAVTWLESKKSAADMEAFGKAAAAYAEANSIAPEKAAVTAADGKAGWTGLDNGYYLVTSTYGTAVSVASTPSNPTQDISEKNLDDSSDKEVKENAERNGTAATWPAEKANSAQIGDTIVFRSKITIAKNTTSLVYHDTMTEGLTWSGAAATKVYSDADLTTEIPAANYTVAEGTDGETFTVTFTEAYLASLTTATTEVWVGYTAVLNNKAKIEGEVNTGKITWGNNGGDTPTTTTTKPHKFEILKYDGADATEKNPLAGAKFQLFLAEEGGEALALAKNADGTVYRVMIAGEALPNGFTAVADKKIVTIADKKITVEGVDDDDYYLEETDAPTGFNPIVGRTKIQVNESNSLVAEIPNESGTQLPSTGGIGTTIFYVLGGLLVVGAGIVLVARRKASE